MLKKYISRYLYLYESSAKEYDFINTSIFFSVINVTNVNPIHLPYLNGYSDLFIF